jgi:hypothetical protein
MLLSEQITQLQILVNFDPYIDENSKKSSCCDNIELLIDYDISASLLFCMKNTKILTTVFTILKTKLQTITTVAKRSKIKLEK